MFCKNCGREIGDGAAFCPGCGTAVAKAAGTDSASNGNMQNFAGGG